MARIRSIKPDFFMHDGLAELSPLHRLLFIGLWTQADREGRLEDRPARIKAAVLPYDGADVDAMLDDLAEHRERFVVRYEVDGVRYLQVTGFAAHQQPHIKEVASKIPDLRAGTVRERCKSGSPKSGPDGIAPGQNPRRGAEGSIEGAVQGAGAEQEGKGAEGAPRGASASAADPLAGHSSELAEAAALCRDHPFLGRMLDPAIVLRNCREAHPELDLVRTVRQAIARLTPERINEQERKRLGPDGFLVHFFTNADRDRVTAASRPGNGAGDDLHARVAARQAEGDRVIAEGLERERLEDEAAAAAARAR